MVMMVIQRNQPDDGPGNRIETNLDILQSLNRCHRRLVDRH